MIDAFNIAAICVCLTSLVYMCLRRRWDKQQSKLFIVLLVDVIVAAASDVTAQFLRDFAVANSESLAAINVAGYLFFVAHTLLAPLFLLYVLAVSRTTLRKDWERNNLVAIPFFLAELAVVTNPLTHWVFSYQADLSYTRHWCMYFIYAVGIFYLVMAVLQLIRSWRALTTVKRRGLTIFFFIAFGGIVIQLLAPSLRVELFAESLALIGILMFVENEEELIDSEAGVYNRHALEVDLGMYENLGHPYYLIAMRVTNADAFSHIGGSTYAAQFVTDSVVGYLRTLMPWYRIYRTAPARFVLLDPQMEYSESSEIAHQVAQRFKESWCYHDVDINLQAVVALACIPDDLQSSADVFYLVDTPVPPVVGKEVLEGGDLNYLLRRAEVERAVQRGLEESEYEVYYQPIYDADGKPCAAEALMRLNDNVLGSIPPLEFIEVAERLGLIDDIGEIALREVCDFLSSGVPQKLGVARISVNLSVIQCMQVDFPIRANEIIASFGIKSNAVTFEITESVAAGDYGFLDSVMNQLKTSGHLFAMDDYGTGYSNMHSFLSLDFDVVKIDKSVLWDAEKTTTGMVILENSVNMLRSVGCEVLVEGVETKSQVELLHRLGVDYYQGFYFAKPMPKQEFVEFLQQERRVS